MRGGTAAPRLSDRVYLQLRDSIVAGELAANTFLSESEVASRCGVSKAPVKTALQSLAQEGFLTCFPRKGYMVTGVSTEEYEYVRELRTHIEQLSVLTAIQRASDEDILSLRGVIRPDADERNPYKTNNTRFHTRLAEITRNPYIGEVLHKLLGITSRYAITRYNIPQETNDIYHEKIIVSLLDRDTDRALEYLAADLHMDTQAMWVPRRDAMQE